MSLPICRSTAIVACSEYGVFSFGDRTSSVEAPGVMLVNGAGQGIRKHRALRNQRRVDSS